MGFPAPPPPPPPSLSFAWARAGAPWLEIVAYSLIVAYASPPPPPFFLSRPDLTARAAGGRLHQLPVTACAREEQNAAAAGHLHPRKPLVAARQPHADQAAIARLCGPPRPRRWATIGVLPSTLAPCGLASPTPFPRFLPLSRPGRSSPMGCMRFPPATGLHVLWPMPNASHPPRVRPCA